MNPLDWLLAILLAYSVIRAAFRGFVREAFALGGLVVGFLIACWGYQTVAKQFSGLITSQPLAQFLAFLLILIAIMAASTLLGHIVKKGASAVGLGFFDRFFGALFGLARGAVLAAALLLSVTAFLPTAPWIQNSLFAPYLLNATHAVSFTMPSELNLRLLEGLEKAGLEKIKHTNPRWIKSDSSSQTNTSSPR